MSQTIITTKDLLLKTKLPKATESYKPVSHRQVIEMTMEQLDKYDLKVLSERYNIAKEGRQGQGYYEIGTSDSEMNIKIGWHNSYDKSMPLRWAIGAHIIICENGMVVGDLGAFKRKHTGDVLEEYRTKLYESVAKAGDIFHKLTMEREQMKNLEITKKASAELIGRMFLEEDLITATQIGIIKREMSNPSYGDYNAPGSVWELYNHCTVAYKEEHPRLYADRHIDHHKFFTKEFSLA